MTHNSPAEAEFLNLLLRNSAVPFGLRRRAARELGRLQSREGLKLLERLSSAQAPADAATAAAAAGAALLSEFYKAETRAVKGRAIGEAQARLSLSGVDRASVRQALLDPGRSPQERAELAAAVSSLGYRECWPDLVRLVAGPDPLVSYAASQAIASLKTRSASRALMSLVRGSNSATPPLAAHVRRAAIDALWWLRDRRAANLLARILLDSHAFDEATRDRAAEALGFCACRPSHAAALVAASRDPSKLVRTGANCGLASLPDRLRSAAVAEALARLGREGPAAPSWQ